MIKNLRSEKEFAGLDPQFKEIPNGYVNKTVCGCGLTSVALENDLDTIIAVPTIYLAINKATQYPNLRCDYNVLAVWGETSNSEIEEYIANNKVWKIMVTYDSLHKVKSLLGKCKLVIDESNELLSKTKLKPEVINKVFDFAYSVKDKVSFISATPTPLSYMPKWIAELDQVTIEWDNTIKAMPILCERTYPFKCLKDEFLLPLKDNESITVAGKTFSKVIVFVNTVNKIAELIRDTKLNKEECGIICGDSLKNDVKIIGINRYTKGELPKFLFVTSSGFCGIDLDCKDSMTIVVSNTAKNWQMIDMLTDLKQAVSRQRNKSNPNYGSYIYIYNQTLFSKSEDELIEMLESIRTKLNKSIRIYDNALLTGDEDGFVPYDDFKAYTLFKDGRYVINEQAFLADKYFILEIRRQYTKGFDIKGSLDNVTEIDEIELPKSTTYSDLVTFFNSENKDGVIDWGIYSTKTEWIQIIETSYRFYKKTWMNVSYAKKMIENYGDDFELTKLEIKRLFVVGNRYTRKEVKEKLQELYNRLGINRVAKHTDLSDDIMKVKEVAVRGVRMVEILSK